MRNAASGGAAKGGAVLNFLLFYPYDCM